MQLHQLHHPKLQTAHYIVKYLKYNYISANPAIEEQGIFLVVNSLYDKSFGSRRLEVDWFGQVKYRYS